MWRCNEDTNGIGDGGSAAGVEAVTNRQENRRSVCRNRTVYGRRCDVGACDYAHSGDLPAGNGRACVYRLLDRYAAGSDFPAAAQPNDLADRCRAVITTYFTSTRPLALRDKQDFVGEQAGSKGGQHT